jgi:hypothetical protein
LEVRYRRKRISEIEKRTSPTGNKAIPRNVLKSVEPILSETTAGSPTPVLPSWLNARVIPSTVPARPRMGNVIRIAPAIIPAKERCLFIFRFILDFE